MRGEETKLQGSSLDGPEGFDVSMRRCSSGVTRWVRLIHRVQRRDPTGKTGVGSVVDQKVRLGKVRVLRIHVWGGRTKIAIKRTAGKGTGGQPGAGTVGSGAGMLPSSLMLNFLTSGEKGT